MQNKSRFDFRQRSPVIGFICLIVEPGFVRGSVGENKYGVPNRALSNGKAQTNCMTQFFSLIYLDSIMYG